MTTHGPAGTTGVDATVVREGKGLEGGVRAVAAGAIGQGVEPPADGSALICCSQPLDDVVLDL
jgi:hypothetical protein